MFYIFTKLFVRFNLIGFLVLLSLILLNKIGFLNVDLGNYIFVSSAQSSYSDSVYDSVKVIGVVDGDTIAVLDKNKKTIKIRLANIDAPEKAQAFGNRAKQFAENKIKGKMVKLRIHSKDQYDRYIAEVFLNDVNINKEIVKNGFAWAYRDFLKDKDYIVLEEQAKKMKRGLWSDTNPTEPKEWRKLNRNGKI